MELTAFEEALVADAAAGNKCDPTKGDLVEPSVGGQWDRGRTIRAEVLEALVTGALVAVHHRGVQIRGARIQGALDLSWSELAQPLSLVQCYFDGPVRAKSAKFKELGLSGSRVTALDLNRANVEGSVRLDAGFSATGEVCLHDANIGDLVCTGATLSNEGGVVLIADGVLVKGNVLLDEGFSANGEVRLLNAEISGSLNLRGATLLNDGGVALSADGAVVKGIVLLDQGFSANGEVRLLNAEIGSQLSLRGATLLNDGGVVLIADGVLVKGNVFLDQGFSANGEVRLLNAEIGSQLVLRGATFLNDGGVVLRADGAVVKGGAFLDEGFSATGEVSFTGAEISGSLHLGGATLSNEGGVVLIADGVVVKGNVLLDEGFSATGQVRFTDAQIAGFWWDDENVEGVLDLRGTTVERLGDRWVQPFRKPGGALLAGFSYTSFIEGIDDSLTLRLAWLRSSPGYTPQPYTQLAAVYRRSGHDERARKVLIAREVDRRKRGQPPPWTKAKSLLLGATVAHGYEPARAVLFLVVLWVIGVALLLGDPGREAMVPTKTTSVTEPAPSSAAGQPTALSCPPRYPCFNPWVYSAETVVPLIELGQTANWEPAGGVNRYRVWVWVATGLGWLFTTLGVAGVTGVIRKE